MSNQASPQAVAQAAGLRGKTISRAGTRPQIFLCYFMELSSSEMRKRVAAASRSADVLTCLRSDVVVCVLEAGAEGEAARARPPIVRPISCVSSIKE